MIENIPNEIIEQIIQKDESLRKTLRATSKNMRERIKKYSLEKLLNGYWKKNNTNIPLTREEIQLVNLFDNVLLPREHIFITEDNEPTLYYDGIFHISNLMKDIDFLLKEPVYSEEDPDVVIDMIPNRILIHMSVKLDPEAMYVHLTTRK